MNPVVLASSSPRRRGLLEAAGIPHRVVIPPEDIAFPLGVALGAAVGRVARAKARAVTAALPPGDIVVAADTVVVGPSGVLGKPRSPRRAREMLAELQGRRHTVLTGVCVLRSGSGAEPATAVSEALVRLRPLGVDEIARYVATGEPLDKAGGYGIQGIAGDFIDEVIGRVDTVIGLDVERTCRLLREIGENGVPAAVADAPAPHRPAAGPTGCAPASPRS